MLSGEAMAELTSIEEETDTLSILGSIPRFEAVVVEKCNQRNLRLSHVEYAPLLLIHMRAIHDYPPH
jgi:hypothetical protein